MNKGKRRNREIVYKRRLCARKDYTCNVIKKILRFLSPFSRARNPDHRDVSIMRSIHVVMYLNCKALYANDAARPFRQCYATFLPLSSHYHLRVAYLYA